LHYKNHFGNCIDQFHCELFSTIIFGILLRFLIAFQNQIVNSLGELDSSIIRSPLGIPPSPWNATFGVHAWPRPLRERSEVTGRRVSGGAGRASSLRTSASQRLPLQGGSLQPGPQTDTLLLYSRHQRNDAIMWTKSKLKWLIHM
jgi:hypothetical protein